MKKMRRDTGQTTVTNFAQHGRMESRIEDNILINEATGPFNAEVIYAIESIQKDLLEMIASHDKWAQIYIFHESALCSLDTVEAIRDYLTKLRGMKKPVATAYVMGKKVEGRSIMASHYRQLYAEATLQYQLFFTEAEAQQWIAAMLEQE